MLAFFWYAFRDLSVDQLYDILAIRSSIFVVDQHCVYLDPDGKDKNALHLLGVENGNLVAYIRLFPPTELQKEIVFGRVLVAQSVRKKGMEKTLSMNYYNIARSIFLVFLLSALHNII